MQFVSFSDDTAMIETVFFPDSYAANRDLLALMDAFFIRGKVEESFGAIVVEVSDLWKASPTLGKEEK